MRENKYIILNFLIYFTLALLFVGFQTSFWPHIFPFYSPLNLWLPLLTYFAVYRNTLDAIIYIYISTLLLHPFTGMSMALFLIFQLLLFIYAKAIKARFFWETTSYFVMVTGLLSIAHLLNQIAVSLILDYSAIPFLRTLIETLWIPVFAPFILFLCQYIDNKTEKPIEWM